LWYGLWVPKGTPKEVIAKLNATMSQILADPQVKQRFEELGIQITPINQQSPEALRDFQKAEAARWWPVMKASNIKAEEGVYKLLRDDGLLANPLQLLQAAGRANGR